MTFLDPNKNKHICPNCFEYLDRTEPVVICTNRECESYSVPVKMITSKGEVQKCEKCGKKLLTRLCPKCSFRLPENWGDVKDYPISIIGAKSTGKSVYIGVLVNELKNDVGEAFSFGFYTTGGDQTAKCYREHYYRYLFDDKTTVPATDMGHVEPMIFSMLSDDKEIPLTFFDTAGENLKEGEIIETHCRYIAHSRGIILLLDPLQLPQIRELLKDKVPLPPKNKDAEEILNGVISVIRKERGQKKSLFRKKNNKIDIPLAVTFTKLDALYSIIEPSSCMHQDSSHKQKGYFDKLDFNNSNEEMMQLVRQWQGSELINLIKETFENYAFFGLSSLGSIPDGENIRHFEPIRVSDPLLWILYANKLMPGK